MRTLLWLAVAAFALVVGARDPRGAVPGAIADELSLQRTAYELSGVSRVEGGYLLAEDELVGSLVFVPAPLEEGPRECQLVKLSRSRQASQPFEEAPRLFAVQDVEAVASDGNTVFVLGSHSPKNGERRPDREFLLQLQWDAEPRELTAGDDAVAQDLLPALVALLDGAGLDTEWSEQRLHPHVDLEGLACTAEHVYVGLRAPVSNDQEAFILKVERTALFSTLDASHCELLRLPLGGLGVRGLEVDRGGDHLLLLAGDAEDADVPRSLLARLDLRDTTLQTLHEFTPEELRGYVPEGVCRDQDGKILVVFDGKGALKQSRLERLEF